MTSYHVVRQHSLDIAAPLSEADMQLQSMPDTSPTKWHLAHTTWFFETFLCQPFIPNYTPFDPSFNYSFNSYYSRIGAQYPRPKRGLISRPSVDEVMAYRDYVDTAIAPLLDNPEHKPLIDIGINHEQQHQELMLTDIKHALFQNPTYPTYSPTTPTWPLYPNQNFCFPLQPNRACLSALYCFTVMKYRPNQVLIRPLYQRLLDLLSIKDYSASLQLADLFNFATVPGRVFDFIYRKHQY